jgi:NAD(P)-dependent dehydrogenase (short-subunit alcohol dehydrogenase family)
MNSLEGKVALVTGAANKRSMGHAVALRLAGEGANVVIMDKHAAPKSLFSGDEGWGGLDAVVDEIKALGRETLAVVADVSSSQEVDEVVDKALKKFGRIDILVHCAAIRGPVDIPITELSEEDWRAVLDVNTTGSFLISRAVARSMIARGEGGKIVLFASMAGLHGVPGSGSYCVSKYGVLGLSQTLALELAQYQINVNAINPGMIITNLRDGSFAKAAETQGIPLNEAREKNYQMLSNRIPLGRLGTVDEIADLVYFLVSDLSRYITGEAIGIGGGVT